MARAVGTVPADPMIRRALTLAAGAAGVASLICTAVIVSDGGEHRSTALLISGLVEWLVLLLLLATVARWSSPIVVVTIGPLLTVAASLWVARFIVGPSTDLLSVIGGCAVWSAASVAAIVAGGYPRLAANRLHRSVSAAREAQRLQLAHDLHDFVAHDVTGIVAQAQAARFAAADDPTAMRAAMERIETVGQQALTAMDSLVGMLRQNPSEPLPLYTAGLAGLPDMVRRFREEREPECSVSFDQPESNYADLPPEIQVAACRVVTESLTNIRRHSPAARRVTISVALDRTMTLCVVVANDLGPGNTPRMARSSPGGHGLNALAERVAALAGRFDAGPDGADGWTVRCELPAAAGTRRR
jgi:signal transduction histidine kinase